MRNNMYMFIYNIMMDDVVCQQLKGRRRVEQEEAKFEERGKPTSTT